jgi:hypothetical protein
MTADVDIWRTAKLLIDQYDDDAPIRAAQRADAQLSKGDMEGRRVWLRVLKAIEELEDVTGRGKSRH